MLSYTLHQRACRTKLEPMPELDPFQSLDPSERAFAKDFEAHLDAVLARSESERAVRPLLFGKTISFAVFDSTGAMIWSDSKFSAWVEPGDLLSEVTNTAQAGSWHSLQKDHAQRPVLLTFATANKAKRWVDIEPALKDHIKQANRIVVAAVSLSHMADEIEYAARALGMSNLEARISAALFAHGSIKRAASHAGVTYHTARKALSGAMKAVGVSRQTSLIRRLSELATFTAPEREAIEDILIDVFELKRRDAKLALLICEGFSRNDAAKIVGISASVAKDRFALIFQKLAVKSATDIPSLIMGAFASAVLLQKAPPLVESDRRSRTPLRLIRSEDGRVIAVNDYGPHTAQPVLVAHSSLSTRHAFTTVIEALQNGGFRPFTIDRPGFGLTDDAPEEMPDRFATGTQDVIRVCNELEFEKIHAITRGGAFHVLALARRAPQRLGQVVMINPDLLQHDCSQRKGHLGLVRRAFDRYPDSIERVARWTAATLSKKRIETIIRAGIGGADADLESFSNRQNMDDYLRSIMAFSTGRLSGFIREQRGYVLQTDIDGLADASNWTVLIGNSDPIHNVDEIKSYWSSKLPGADFQTIPSAGRFISLSHPSALITALASK